MRIVPVTERALTFVLGASMSLSACLGQSAAPHGQEPAPAIRVLDLRQRPDSSAEEVVPAPGAVIGGATGESSRLYSLPLSAKIKSAKLVGGRIEIRMLLANVGKATYSLPVSRKIARVRSAGNQGRRTFLISINLMDRSGSKWEEGIVDTGSSTSIPDSAWEMHPGAAVLVRFDVDLSLVPGGLRGREVLLKAFCEEWELENARYRIEKRSETVSSDQVPIEF